MSANCLNCETPLQGSFCHKCGQKSSTHRITFAKFIQHDLIHGIFHLDKGVLFTLNSLLFKPGYAARKYIKGARVKHYNIFALFLIVVALKSLLDHLNSPEGVFTSKAIESRQADDLINGAINHYYKLFYLLIIPLLSAFSFILLKRLKYNFVEHIVLNTFIFTGGFFYALILSLTEYLTGILHLGRFGNFLMVFYFMLGYFQVTYGLYPFWGYLWRALLTILLFLTSLLLVLILIVFIFYGGVFQGNLNPL